MPRRARLDTAGVLYHIIIRGIERRRIFLDDQDRENFLHRLSELLPKTHTRCYAWAFLPNHAHFLLRTGGVPLATVMGRLLTGYAVSFNRRHRRHGQLFQNRYKSIVCQEDIYFKELIRYIHLNPIRANLVSGMDELKDYEFCGHGTLVGKRERPWQETKDVLLQFGETEKEARGRYVKYMKEGVGQGRRPELVGGGLIRSLGGWDEVKKLRRTGQDRMKGDERILGESDFVDEVLLKAEDEYRREYDLKRRGYDLKMVVRRVAEIYGMEEDELFSPGRQKRRSEARSVLLYWAIRELGLSGTYMARQLEMSQPGIVYAVKRGERVAKAKGYRLT